MATVKQSKRLWQRALIASVFFALASVGCGDDESSPARKGGSGAVAGSGGSAGQAGGSGGSGNSAGSAGGGAGAPDCYENPKTHLEIINACTDADKLDKQPNLPLLLSDGSLPPLP